ncbi:MAG: flagellar motor protein MotB [Desulforhabdus sp.]|jgi:chemotaxis protein MotB|nr:flagellar motor protein MotB [Desulforhabdus sp.]
MARKEAPSGKKDTNGWITTYTDLMTLLLTFFVLLLSMSQREEIRTRKALNSLVGAFGLLPGGRSPIGKTKGTDVRDAAPPVAPSTPVDFEVLKQLTVTTQLDPMIQILKQKEKLVVRINQRALFVPGSNELTPEIRHFLTLLVAHLQNSEEDIEIHGHTDHYEAPKEQDWPQKSWLLSAQRAQAVHHFLLQQGIDFNRLSAHGFSYFQPIIDNNVFPELRHKNQRVELLLGASTTVPKSLLRDEPKPKSFLNYKNFLFNILPSSKKQADNSDQDAVPGRYDQ